MSDTTTTSAITINQFRDLLPEFTDSSVFYDETIEPWLIIGTGLLDPIRWGAMYNMGLALFAAHQITLARQAAILAQRGGIPGFGYGVMQSKSINGVSVSYNSNLSALTDGGDWNLTIYGVRFLSFARMFGSGGVQLMGSDAASVSEADLLRGNIPYPNF